MTVSSAEVSLLSVENLEVSFPIPGTKSRLRAVDGISFKVDSGRTLGLVGESGSGKSSAARAILNLTSDVHGRIHLKGQNVMDLRPNRRRRALLPIQMIFQDPTASLNPFMTIGDIVAEPIDIAGKMTASDRRARVSSLLQMVGLHASYASRRSHSLSGGQRQRVGIARALAAEPDLIICDEAVSALDVSIQAQILNLLQDIQERTGIAYLFISHDLGVISHLSHHVAVLYLGRIVEVASRDRLFSSAAHPYTQALLQSAPVADPRVQRSRRAVHLQGERPSPINPPSGCTFRTRCPIAQEACSLTRPPLIQVAEQHEVACHFWQHAQALRTDTKRLLVGEVARDLS